MSFSNTLPPQTRQILHSVPSLINKTFPVPARFRSTLPSQIAELSRLLTNNRGGRSLSYLGRPNFLSAYLHYFLPWNLYRLCLLLQNMEINLSQGDVITDLGSGPLTFISALWIARPDLRNIPLKIYCIDRSAPALEAGKKFFDSLCGSKEENPWKINLKKEDININKKAASRKNRAATTAGTSWAGKAALVCAVNMFNEIYENIPHNNSTGLRRIAENAAELMHNHALKDAFLLTVEPGIPQSGHFISCLRAAFMELNRPPLAPCTHTTVCPYTPDRKSGGKKKWCHFAYETFDVPKELVQLSAAAKLPKERLVLSYLLTGKQQEKSAEIPGTTRVISDAFPIPNNQFGRYGCCEQGLVLLTGEKSRIDKIDSGSIVQTSGFTANIRDKKSGAYIMEL